MKKNKAIAEINIADINSGTKHRPILQQALQDTTQFKVAIVYPITSTSIGDTFAIAALGLMIPVFIGPIATMKKIAKDLGKDLSQYECIDASNSELAAQRAIDLAREHKVQAIMKADIKTADLLHPVVASKNGLRTERRISHCTALDVPTYKKLMFFTDCAVNTYPNLEVKKAIIQNAIDFAITFGIDNPKAAILAAVETVTDKMPDTVAAATLTKIAQNGKIQGGIVYGPLAFDDAISPEAAVYKHIDSVVAGSADIFVVPNIEMGNNMLKALRYLAQGKYVGIVIGAKVPLIVLSRYTTTTERIFSTAYAKIYFNKFYQLN